MHRFIVYLKIFCQVGLLYIMEVVSWLVGGPEAIWYLTDAINSLRGLLIFLIFCCKPKVWKGIQRKNYWNQIFKIFKKDTKIVTAGLKVDEKSDKTGSKEAVEIPLEEKKGLDFSKKLTK